MAVPARKPPEKSVSPSIPESKLRPVQSLAAQLLGQGYTVPQVAERLVDYIVQNSNKGRKLRIKTARGRIRKWAKTEEFRQAMWDTAVIQLDLESPAILRGIARKAKAGRVDAAKLALEVTARHTPKGDIQAAHVEVVFQGVPRPQRGFDVELPASEVEEEEEAD